MFKIKDGLRIGSVVVIDSAGNLITKAADADKLDGEDPSFYTNATNMASGTLDEARLPASVYTTNTLDVFSNTVDGLVPAPGEDNGLPTHILFADGTWKNPFGDNTPWVSWDSPVTANGTGSAQTVSLPESGLDVDDVMVFVDGIRWHTDEYTIDGDEITLTTNLPGERIEIIKKMGIDFLINDETISNYGLDLMQTEDADDAIDLLSSNTSSLMAGKLRLESTFAANLTSTEHAFQVGSSSDLNVAISNEGVQARNNGSSNTLRLNPTGGNVVFTSSLWPIMPRTLRPGGINGDLTLTPGDNGRFRRVIGANNRTWTIAPEADGAWESGAFIIVAPTGGATLTIARGSGVSLFYNGTNANRTISATGFAILIHSGTADQWFMIGTGIS